MEQKTCKERIAKNYRERIKEIRGLMKKSDYDELSTFGLCLDYVEGHTDYNKDEGYIRWQLSYGGPSDEFRFYLNELLHPRYIEYAFSDWFDGAEMEAHKSDKGF